MCGNRTSTTYWKSLNTPDLSERTRIAMSSPMRMTCPMYPGKASHHLPLSVCTRYEKKAYESCSHEMCDA
jgi:hypothetical protein